MSDASSRGRWLAFAALPVLAAVGLYMVGPRPAPATLPAEAPDAGHDLVALEARINASEAAFPNIKPDNHARIIWADASSKTRTDCSVVYLHGFSASQGEGEPMHREFAQRYGCNLFLARLDGHGLDTPMPLIDITADSLIASAVDAIGIGQSLGEHVYIMATSTGGTLALPLVAKHGGVDGLILYSPNIRVSHPLMFLASKPWGLRIGRMAAGGKFVDSAPKTEEVAQYWQSNYRVEALVAVQNLVASTMKKETFKQVDIPVFVGAYYQDKENQDNTVSVKAMRKMFGHLATADENKRLIEFAEVGSHPLASKYTSEDLASVRDETFLFAEEVLGLKPVTPVVLP